ncbi:MAG TPA: 1-acyl-sn-glycerol-3-phosphate acyltransferase [Clostridiaceae bacterium]|nr:1-acyl-sn-glycerol-3-phosphate acyltransferase [Clostridiaceae bacterium]
MDIISIIFWTGNTISFLTFRGGENSLYWHRFVFKALQIFLGPVLVRKLNYSYEKVKPSGYPYIILANHNTDYDPFLVGMAFPHHMYYVASEHIFRWGFVSRLINFLVAPIPRVKGTTEIYTAINILKRLKDGANVCMFAEGNRSFSGETNRIHPSTGKLVKKSGVNLITFRFDGGYFTSPRWSKTIRRGMMKGRMVREYSAEELKKMTWEEINEAVQNDLYVNAYEEQKKNPIEYKGEKLAENLETALYLCPKCGGTETLKSEDDRFYCSCGLDLRYNTYGYFVSNNNEKPPFETVLEWYRYQEKYLMDNMEKIRNYPSDRLIYSDEEQTLWKAAWGKKNSLIGKGKLLLYNDRLVFDCTDKKYVFELKDIMDLGIIGQKVIAFATNDRQAYEIKSERPRSALKYREMIKYLKN